MDALYPRLLVTRFAECFRFYDAVLPELMGAVRKKGDPSAQYANWDVDEQAVVVLYDRATMAATAGTSGLPASPRGDAGGAWYYLWTELGILTDQLRGRPDDQDHTRSGDRQRQ